MLALEMLGRRAHNDHPNNFSRSPPYTEDVKWLLGLAAKLGKIHRHPDVKGREHASQGGAPACTQLECLILLPKIVSASDPLVKRRQYNLRVLSGYIFQLESFNVNSWQLFI